MVAQIAVTNVPPFNTAENIVNDLLLGDDLETSNWAWQNGATNIGYFDGFVANIGFEEGCQKSLYTLTDDGTIYAEWTEEYPFEIGHFLWSWEFPIRDMELSKSKIIVNGKESPNFINELLVDGYTYRAEFTSKDYDTSKDADFLPPDL